MGLDSDIMLRNKNIPELDLQFGYFRKYFELDDWIRRCHYIEEVKEVDGYFECTFTYRAVVELLKEIKPIYEVVKKYDISKLSYYEDKGEGYPVEIEEQLYGKGDFSPTESQSFAPALKLINLYMTLFKMQEIMEDDRPGNFYFVYTSSF